MIFDTKRPTRRTSTTLWPLAKRSFSSGWPSKEQVERWSWRAYNYVLATEVSEVNFDSCYAKRNCRWKYPIHEHQFTRTSNSRKAPLSLFHDSASLPLVRIKKGEPQGRSRPKISLWEWHYVHPKNGQLFKKKWRILSVELSRDVKLSYWFWNWEVLAVCWCKLWYS